MQSDWGKKIPRWFPNEASKTILSHTTSHHASEDFFYKIRLFFSRTLKLIIRSFCMNNQHFNFWSSNDIYHVNFLLICLLNRNSSLRESKIRITEICSSNPFRKYRSSNRLALLQRITHSSNISSLLKNGTPHSRYFSDELGVLNFFVKI